MKRTAIFLASGLVGTLGLTSVAAAQEFSLYGSIRSGIIHQKPDGGEGRWDLGSVDAGDVPGGDRLWSRIGVKGSYDLGNGMTSGATIEKRLDGWRTRHQNVWLEGSLGRVTLGQQGSPYHSAVSWDGSNFTGGTWDESSRQSGVTFSSSTGGPFNFGIMFVDDNSIGGHSSEDAVDRYEMGASFGTDLATVTLGYRHDDDDAPYEVGGTVGGSAGGLTWEVGYQKNEDTYNLYGFHTGYGVGGGNAYLNYEDYNADDATNAMDDRIVIVGYSHGIGPNTKVIGEYKNQKEGTDMTILALRVDF